MIPITRSRGPAPLLLFLGLVCADAVAAQAPTQLRLMTFNIRYGTAQDGDHIWANRRDLVADIIEREAADVLAIQEALDFQLDDLAPALRGYRKLGQHRDGGTGGEFSGLYVREDRVRIVDWGEFWLSPTPEVVASRGWDAALHRMAVWVDIVPVGSDEMIRVYGTHFDHRGEVARVESAGLIARHASGAGRPAAVLGDLNAADGSEVVRAFADLGYRSAIPALHPEVTLGTFNGFEDPRGGGRRIDHILVGPGLRATSAAILDDRVQDLFPSDHFPVVAVVEVRPGA
ncbi:MAG: endonuclease/exonuclease/phosphatase family protein [Gemmatimonadota bacterium]|jgi:endonuclease/exonuclease/phosphatase family metal-dependent hydrolase